MGWRGRKSMGTEWTQGHAPALSLANIGAGGNLASLDSASLTVKSTFIPTVKNHCGYCTGEDTRTIPDTHKVHCGIIKGPVSSSFPIISCLLIQMQKYDPVACSQFRTCFIILMTWHHPPWPFLRKLILNFSRLSYRFATNTLYILLKYVPSWSYSFAFHRLLSVGFRRWEDCSKSCLQVTNLVLQIFVETFHPKTSHECVCLCMCVCVCIYVYNIYINYICRCMLIYTYREVKQVTLKSMWAPKQ